MFNPKHHVYSYLLVFRAGLVTFTLILKDVVLINASNFIQFGITPFCIPVLTVYLHCLFVIVWNKVTVLIDGFGAE